MAKKPNVVARIISAVKKSDATAQLSEMETYNAGDWIEPEYSLKGLKAFVNESPILPQCIKAYKNNICGFGLGVRYKDDIKEAPEMAAEFEKAEKIISLLSQDCDTKQVFEEAIGERETYGIAYIEVMRDNVGELSQISLIKDTVDMKKTKPLPPYVEYPFMYDGEEILRKKKFRKYKQEVNGQTVYFREFGDPRIMDMRDGHYLDEGETLEIQYQANEILDLTVGTKPYGEVRWIGQTLGVDGSRRAEILNNSYFRKGRHTPMAVLIKGGTLTDESRSTLQQYADNIEGEKGQHSFILLEMESTDGRTDFDQKEKPEIEIKELANILQKDELFQDYIDNSRRRVQSSFQLPDLYVAYTTDFNRATAQTAQEVTEKQVFQPERQSLAWIINNKLLNGYGFKYVEVYFKTPDISNPDDIAKLLSVCRTAGGITPNFAKEIVYNAYGRVAEDYEGEWGNIPIGVDTQAGSEPEKPAQGSENVEKAQSHDDEVVAVMREVKKMLQSDGKNAIIKYREDQERDDEGKFTDGGVSPSGANTFTVRGFRSAQKLNNHWQNGRVHRDQYKEDGITTKEQYVARALELIESPTSDTILGHTDKDGNIIRYDKERNDFVKGHPNKGITTLFKPDEKQKYYDKMRKADVEHGGKD